MKMKDVDPRGLINDSYRIDGISAAECRSIFLDWALGVSQGLDVKAQMDFLLSHFAPENPDHPMTHILHSDMDATNTPKRRGGRKARLDHDA